MRQKAHTLGICHVQFIIDNPYLTSAKTSAHFGNKINPTVIRKVKRELGIISQYKHGRRRTPEAIAEWCNYDVLETADKLVQYGYGWKMKTSDLLRLCGVS